MCFSKSTKNCADATVQSFHLSNLRSWCVMWAVVCDDLLCHPLPHCPRGNTSHKARISCACVSRSDCVWVMYPPHAIVQISGVECFQQVIPSFTVSAATSRRNPLCAKQNRMSLCAIMCACKMTCHHLPVGCSRETKACRDRLNSSAAIMRGSERTHVPCWQGETFLTETEAPLRRHQLKYVLPNTSAV